MDNFYILQDIYFGVHFGALLAAIIYQIILLTHDKIFFQTVLSSIKVHHANELRVTGETRKDILEISFFS